MMITFGKFRMVDLGDLHWNQEYDLACPNNLLGTVDVYMTTHHAKKTSGAPAIVQACVEGGDHEQRREQRRERGGMGNHSQIAGTPDIWQPHAEGTPDVITHPRSSSPTKARTATGSVSADGSDGWALHDSERAHKEGTAAIWFPTSGRVFLQSCNVCIRWRTGL
jgi:hypothetical protein